MSSSIPGSVLAVLVLSIGQGQARAADLDAAMRCAVVAEDQARLACYDGIFRRTVDSAPMSAGATGAPTGVSAGAGATSPANAPVVAAPANPAADFGLTPARKESIQAAEAKESNAPAAPKAPPAPDSMTAKVATVANRLTGELVVILDDGQVWVQIDTETKGKVKEGDEVTIRKATLGSYFLVTPNHILVRVRRVK